VCVVGAATQGGQGGTGSGDARDRRHGGAGGGGGHVRTGSADSGGICGGVDGSPLACCDDAGEVARSGGRAAEEQAEAEVAEMCEWAGCGDLN
jgi:hypothetical protein